ANFFLAEAKRRHRPRHRLQWIRGALLDARRARWRRNELAFPKADPGAPDANHFSVAKHVPVDELAMDERAVLAAQIRDHPCLADLLHRAVPPRQQNIPDREVALR